MLPPSLEAALTLDEGVTHGVLKAHTEHRMGG